MSKKSNITTVLFGLDGVIVDTSKAQEQFWNEVAESKNLKIDDFPAKIDGMTINAIIDLYFNLETIEDKDKIREESASLSASTNYSKIVIPGVIDFIKYLKDKDYKIGLVTSSNKQKVQDVLKALNLTDAFDTVITAESIKKGKPDPMGFLLAQTNLGVQADECAVFEDAFTGIKAATYAFMRVIGVTTTLSGDFLKDYT